MSCDDRFSRFRTDAKFVPAPRSKTKVKIDPRFKGLFKDKRFVSSEVKVDKRGRPKAFSAKENYKKYYRMDKDEEDDEEEEEKESNQDSSEDGENESKSQSEGDSETEKDDNNKLNVKPKVRSKLKDMSVDYARGEGLLDSDSSSSEEEEEEVEEEEEEDNQDQFDKWGELDHDAERMDSEATKRLAVCNMDWDRVGADDIFMALSSFCPPGGNVKEVKVILSEFGKKRLDEEDLLGPEELRKESKNQNNSESSDDSDHEMDEKKAMERVRMHQVNRLKYYYAVAEFDSVSSANTVYEECDGAEYELSATRFDLRFIPDDMTFDIEEVKQTCSTMPNPDEYQPKLFNTTALQQGKVELTWDETDPKRMAAMQRAFAMNDDEEDNDVKAYLAMSDSEAEDQMEHRVAGSDDEGVENDEEVIAKYKALFAEISAKEKKKEEEKGNMEVIFNGAAEEAVKQDMKKKEEEKMTPWEKYLSKKKEKKTAKRNARKEEKEKQSEESDDIPSDVDMNDPFFKSEFDDSPKESKKSKNKKRKEKKRKGESAEDDKELALLAMDSDDEKQHFDYKEIVKKETKKQKKNRKRAREEGAQEDNFKIDLADSRFSAVFNHADFNVDPSHPSFKKTKSMKDIIDEKQKRIVDDQGNGKSTVKESKKVSKDLDLDRLVKSVQVKTKNKQNLKDKKGKKMK